MIVSGSRSQRLAWLAFSFACFQMTFLEPSMVLFQGQRANVFSGLLCGIAGIMALFAMKDRKPSWKWPELLVCLVLSGLTVASAFCSADPFSSGLRSFVLLTSGLGGFWSARILLGDPVGWQRFQWLCTALLIGAMLWGLAGVLALGKIPSDMFREHEHPVNSVILLLWVGPLGLIARGGRLRRCLGLLLVGLSYVVILLSRKMSAVWMPLLAVAMGGALTIRRGGRFVALGLAFMGIAASLSIFYVPGTYGVKSLSVWFRAENYPFSVHIAKQHPFLGIGLCSVREQYLEDYHIQYPGVTKDQFREVLWTNRTPENTFLTFMTDLGFPFVLIYMASVASLLWWLVASLRYKPPEPFMNPLVILVPLVAVLLYFQLYDGLIYPQVNWFFHVLLGMIPTPWARVGWVREAAPAGP
jgi:hypothetical protein